MLFPDTMNDERSLRAVQRIEAALTRIEAATDHLPPPRDDSELRELRAVHQALRGKVDQADRSELEALRTAHGRLRGRVERTIAELDELIAEREEAAG